MSYGCDLVPSLYFYVRLIKTAPLPLQLAVYFFVRYSNFYNTGCRSSPHANEVWWKVIFYTCHSVDRRGVGFLACITGSMTSMGGGVGSASVGVCLGGRWADPPELEKNGRYTSYWNAFLLFS